MKGNEQARWGGHLDNILALDQGTSSSRAFVFNRQGQVLGQGQQAFDLILPASGWVEQDPEALWETILASARSALSSPVCPPESICGVGITNQRETTLLWDRRSGRCIHNAIVWQDRRTADVCAELKDRGLEPFVKERTGLVLDPYFSATKLAWLLDRDPQLRRRAERGEVCAGTVDTWLIYRLSRGRSFVTDATNASRTLLYDIHLGDWSPDLLALFGIPRALLPDVVDSSGDFGEVHPDWFGKAMPIRGVAGDQQAALIGQGCFVPGMVKSTYGTGCFVMANAGLQAPVSNHKLLTTVAWRLGGSTTYALEGSIFVAGQAVKWLRDSMGLITQPADTEKYCRQTEGDTGGVYLVPAFVGLGAPHWQPDTRAILSGMTLSTGVAEVVTATVASVVFQTHDLLQAMAADGTPVAALRVDGGMVVNDWLCQHLADILGIPVERPALAETTVLGAAMLAGVGSGLYPDLKAAADMWRCERRFHPAMDSATKESHLAGWARAMRQALCI
ncbi:MAG: glycerol kinase GlpK [Gammaproteobacteria bacterium]|nr:glycerol kinase GlpK [Gammaproteobacteria bacterium]